MKRASGALLAGLLLVLAGCTSAEEDSAAARREIQAMLDEYLPVLAQAYAERDATLLEPWVAQKEVARVHQRIEELADEGRVLQPVFHQATVEEVNVWGHANAFVTSHEVWDLHSVTLGNEQPVQEVRGQANRVRYQLKRDQGRWRVLFRTVAE